MRFGEGIIVFSLAEAQGGSSLDRRDPEVQLPVPEERQSPTEIVKAAKTFKELVKEMPCELMSLLSECSAMNEDTDTACI